MLGWLDRQSAPVVTWVFVLQKMGNRTRLIVRARGGRDYRFRGLPPWLSMILIRLVNFVMQRRQLLGIAWRADTLATPEPSALTLRAASA